MKIGFKMMTVLSLILFSAAGQARVLTVACYGETTRLWLQFDDQNTGVTGAYEVNQVETTWISTPAGAIGEEVSYVRIADQGANLSVKGHIVGGDDETVIIDNHVDLTFSRTEEGTVLTSAFVYYKEALNVGELLNHSCYVE